MPTSQQANNKPKYQQGNIPQHNLKALVLHLMCNNIPNTILNGITPTKAARAVFCCSFMLMELMERAYII